MRRRCSEVFGNIRKYSEAFGSIRKHSKALFVNIAWNLLERSGFTYAIKGY